MHKDSKAKLRFRSVAVGATEGGVRYQVRLAGSSGHVFGNVGG